MTGLTKARASNVPGGSASVGSGMLGDLRLGRDVSDEEGGTL